MLKIALLVAAAVGIWFLRPASPDPLLIEVEKLPKGTTVLEIGELRLRDRTIIYSLVAESRSDKTVNIQVRVEPGATKGITAKLALVEPIRPAGRETFRLVIGSADELGPFQARITLFADELPDWSKTYEYEGTMADIPLNGNYLEVRPSGIDFGKVRPGDKKTFSFGLANIGDAAVTVTEVRVRDDMPVRLADVDGGFTIKPGDVRKVEGEATISGRGKRYLARLEVRSDAVNGKVRNVSLRGTLQGDYDVSPERLPARSAYALLAPLYKVRISAANGVKPFVVSGVTGMDPLFELAEPLGEKPASEQTVALRLRKDAPAGEGVKSGTVRFTLEPSGRSLEWPFQLNVLAPVYAQPSRINFGTVQRAGLNKAIERKVRVIALPGRLLQLTAVRAKNRYFQPRLAEHRKGMPWEIIVALPALADKGVYRDQILVTTTDEAVPTLVIPVRAIVK